MLHQVITATEAREAGYDAVADTVDYLLACLADCRTPTDLKVWRLSTVAQRNVLRVAPALLTEIEKLANAREARIALQVAA